MNRNFGKKKFYSHYAADDKQHGFFSSLQLKIVKRSLLLLAALLSILLIVLLTHGNPDSHWSFSSIRPFSFFSHWLMPQKKLASNSDHQKNKQQNEKTKPQLVQTQIHFEFYDTLTNAQIEPTNLVTTEKNASNLTRTEVSAPLLSPKSHLVAQNTKPSSIKNINARVAQQAALAKKIAKLVKSDPQKLAQEFSSEMIKTEYIIQLGVFKNSQSAERLHASLSLRGYHSKIVPAKLSGKKMYRVQLGPFTMSEAKMIQQQLQNKNITGLIRPTYS